jgi:hypothetical protein
MHFTPVTMELAAYNSRTRALEWLHAAGAPLDIGAIRQHTLEAGDARPQQLEWVSAHGGHEWSGEELQGFMQDAICQQNQPLLHWLRACHVSWPDSLICCPTYTPAAVLWALRQGCPFGTGWSSKACARVSGGRRSVLRELHSMGAPCTCPRS